MQIVQVDKIPDKSLMVPVPLDKPEEVLGVCRELQALCEAQAGIGISAVQVGIPWNLFLVKGDGSCPLVPKGEYGYFAECEYEAVTEEQVGSLEGCLSLRLPNGRLRFFHVDRHKLIKIKGYKLEELLFVKLEDTLILSEENQGIVFQHEIDHGFQILISDIGKEIVVLK